MEIKRRVNLKVDMKKKKTENLPRERRRAIFESPQGNVIRLAMSVVGYDFYGIRCNQLKILKVEFFL